MVEAVRKRGRVRAGDVGRVYAGIAVAVGGVACTSGYMYVYVEVAVEV